MKKKVLYLLTLALLAAVPALQAYAEEEYYEEEYEEDGEEKFAYRMRGCHVESGLSLEEMDADFSEYGAG